MRRRIPYAVPQIRAGGGEGVMSHVEETIVLALWLATGPASAHDWYTGKVDPVTNGVCCGDKDCYRLDASQVQLLKNGDYFIPVEQWEIPRARVQASEDDGYHICTAVMVGPGGNGPGHDQGSAYYRTWQCFFAPQRSASVH
jgi:hypothetical protein